MTSDITASEPRALTITGPLLQQAEREQIAADEVVSATQRQDDSCAEAEAEARELSVRWTNEKRETQRQAYLEYQNPCRDWQGLSELTVKQERAIEFVDAFRQWAVEIERPRLALAKLRAQADAAGKRMEAAHLRAEIADRHFRDSMNAITAEEGIVLAVSSRVVQLQDEAKAASKAYFSILDAIEQETRRQERQMQQIASVGLIRRGR